MPTTVTESYGALSSLQILKSKQFSVIMKMSEERLPTLPSVQLLNPLWIYCLYQLSQFLDDLLI